MPSGAQIERRKKLYGDLLPKFGHGEVRIVFRPIPVSAVARFDQQMQIRRCAQLQQRTLRHLHPEQHQVAQIVGQARRRKRQLPLDLATIRPTQPLLIRKVDASLVAGGLIRAAQLARIDAARIGNARIDILRRQPRPARQRQRQPNESSRPAPIHHSALCLIG